MADDEKKSLGNVDPDNPLPETSQYHEGDAEKLPDDSPLEEGVQAVAKASEEIAKSEPLQAWDSGVKSVQRAMDDVADTAAEPHGTHAVSDTFAVPVLGTITLPGGVYTFVFGILGVLTVLEVLIAEAFKGNESVIALKIALLVGLGLVKATLVVLFYMHLKDDNPIFAGVLLMPLMIAALSILFVLGVPTGEGMGYAIAP